MVDFRVMVFGLGKKLTEIVIDNRIKAEVKFHDILHGFCRGRGTGTAIIEARLHQELASVNQFTLFSVFLDLRKADDSLD